MTGKTWCGCATIGTVDLDYIENIIGVKDVAVYNDQTGTFQALLGDQIDATVISLPTALFVTAVQVPEATVADVVLILRAVVVRAEQWPRVKAQFFDIDAIVEVFPQVLHGFGINMSVWVIALVPAVFRSLHGPWFAPLKMFSIVYIDLLRGLPSLLLVLLFGFGIPALRIPGLPQKSIFWGAVAMISSYSAYAAEVYRSGMDAVHDGQRAAALLFLAATIPMERLTDYVTKKDRERRLQRTV